MKYAMVDQRREYKNVGGIYGCNGARYFILYGAMCVGIGMCNSNRTCINSIKCVCSNINQNNKRRTKEKVKLGVDFVQPLCYYISVNKVYNS